MENWIICNLVGLFQIIQLDYMQFGELDYLQLDLKMVGYFPFINNKLSFQYYWTSHIPSFSNTQSGLPCTGVTLYPSAAFGFQVLTEETSPCFTKEHKKPFLVHWSVLCHRPSEMFNVFVTESKTP